MEPNTEKHRKRENRLRYQPLREQLQEQLNRVRSARTQVTDARNEPLEIRREVRQQMLRELEPMIPTEQSITVGRSPRLTLLTRQAALVRAICGNWRYVAKTCVCCGI